MGLPSIREWAKTRKVGRQCWVCSLPKEQLALVNQARKEEQSVGAIRDWLIQVAKHPTEEPTPARIIYHFARDHHQRAGK